MGAYYQATVNKTRYGTWDLGQGAKLMEHSYIGNEYVESVMSLLENKPKELRWVCDYSENKGGFDWDDTEEESLKNVSCYDITPVYFAINHTKEMYIDMAELIQLHHPRSMMMHPIPFLCNSEKGAMGGGDLHREESRRGLWYGDTISISMDKDYVTSFKNVTADMLFIEH